MRHLKACTQFCIFLFFACHALADHIVADDHGDTINTATPLVFGIPGQSSGVGEIEEAYDVDVFKLVLSSGGVLTLSSSSFMDTYGELPDASGRVLASDDSRWYIHFMSGRNSAAGLSGKADIPRDKGFQFAGIGDLNGGGKDDVMLRHQSTGRWY